MDRIHPSIIREKTEKVTKLLKELFRLKSKDEIAKKQIQIEKEIKDMENIEFLKEYCNNVSDILAVFTNEPNEQVGDKSLLRLLNLNKELSIKVIRDLNLCSEPDY